MSLVADYSATSSSSSESEDSSDGSPVKGSSSSKPLLPSASSLLISGAKKTGEVFQNRFKLEEQTKKASLEQHVKMVENDEHLNTKNGRKICWNYRKGRCRFGSKCQYAHDSDLIMADDNKINTKEIKIATENTAAQSTNETPKQALKRKRPGLGDSITPGKRVMNVYTQQKQQQLKQ